MKGAVHGVAATVASAPVKNEPGVARAGSERLAGAGQRAPTTITPERLRAITNRT